MWRLGWLGVVAGCGLPVGAGVDLGGELCLLGVPGGDAARAAIDDTALSFVHMATCADLAGQLDAALGGALVTLGAGDEAPSGGFVATDDGYVRSDGPNRVIVAYLLGQTYDRAGREGDPVPADLFALDSYLVGATPTATADGGVSIAYDRPGPLAELLGQGADPPNPIRLSAAELAAPSHLLGLRATVTLEIAETTGSGVVTHLVTTPAVPRSQLLGETPLTLQIQTHLEAAAGTLDGESGDLLFRRGARKFTGELDWELLGGEVEAGGTYTWVDAADPVVAVSCY